MTSGSGLRGSHISEVVLCNVQEGQARYLCGVHRSAQPTLERSLGSKDEIESSAGSIHSLIHTLLPDHPASV